WGVCVTVCTPSTLTSCSGSCVDTNTDLDNCGGCGIVCTGGFTCSAGHCVCSPLTACPGPDDCGTIPDGCGGSVSCGDAGCSAPNTCGGGGTPNVCGCTASPPVLCGTGGGTSCGSITD